MRRPQLSTELLSASGASSSSARTQAVRFPCALLVGAILLVSGCQSTNSLTRLFSKPKLNKDKSVLAILDQDRDQDRAGLPLSSKSKSKPNGDSLPVLLDRAEKALSIYYTDGSPAHLTEAHRCYEQALALESGNPESHHGLAIVCDLQKDYSSAELHYRAALDGDPDNGKILGDLGYCYVLQNRFSEAESTLLKATKLDPSNTQAVKNLAYVYAKQGNYNLADSTFRRVMNEVEVRQEMAQLFPHGRPDMAREGERGKLPWQKNDGITTDEFKQRMDNAREQSLAEMRDNHKTLDQASAPALTIEQQQAQIAQLKWERDEALRMVDARAQQSSNTPLVLDSPPLQTGGVVPAMQIQPQIPSRPANTIAGTPNSGNQPNSSGNRVQNGFYPNRPLPQPPQDPHDIMQAGSQNQAGGPNGQRIEPAIHLTDREIDPRTGRPRNTQIQQMEGREPLLVPNGLSTPDQQDPQFHGPGAASSGRAASFEEAKRRAAMAGLGGPEMMFPVTTPEGGNRMAPGSGSTWNGGQFPQPQRFLPMDAAPHNLQQLMDAPSGEMTVQPNHMGQLNSPAGRSFSNPNFQQPLSPQIPLDSPLGNQGTNYANQVDSAQRFSQQQLQQSPPSQQQYEQYSSQPNGDMTITPRPANRYNPGTDPRDSVNSELNQYGQSFQHNSAQSHSNSWNQTPTPSNGLSNPPRAESPSQLMGSSWNQQQLAPQLTPPPYLGRSNQSAGADQYSTQRGYETQYGGTDSPQSGGESYEGSSASARYSEPAPIYSPGVQAPPAYHGGSRSSYSGGPGYNGPRITPASR